MRENLWIAATAIALTLQAAVGALHPPLSLRVKTLHGECCWRMEFAAQVGSANALRATAEVIHHGFAVQAFVRCGEDSGA